MTDRPGTTNRIRPPWQGGGGRVGRVVSVVLFLGVLIGSYYWVIERVEVPADHVLVLINKTGKSVPPELGDQFGDQVVFFPELVSAISSRTGEEEEKVRNRYKGIRYDVLTEGRYFFNPYFYKRMIFPMTIIGVDEVGVKVRQYGQPLPYPKSVATEPNERGPMSEKLTTGRYPINQLAYSVQKFPILVVPEGHAGVVTMLSGEEAKSSNTYTVDPGHRGVQRETLTPGRYPYNPYLEHIELVDLRSQKYDMLADDVIQFPSNDSFTITMEGTIEWSIRPDMVARVTVAYGDKQDILNKVILPNTRSIARIQGSKLQAREFISGKTRTAFQHRFLDDLRKKCWEQGIEIKSALVRDIQPPPEIARLISQREQAAQEIERSMNQMEEAKSQARLVEQQEMQHQNAAVGDARRDVVTNIKRAEQSKVVAVTEANQEFEVAKLTLEAAEKEAAAVISRGAAEAKVVLLEYEARAEPLKYAVAAFGDGETYAQQHYLTKVAPSIKSILSNTEGPFADIFKQFHQMTPAGTGAPVVNARVNEGGAQ
jgi:regulator of protease activity HflC (stomatin/prohibitin superfamily)